MPVDQYIGGVEHAILHLMYARFFVKALADLELLDVQEPFQRLFTQGMITRDGAKMSKSKGNVICPAGYVERYGADTARCYILFIGPPDQDADWSRRGRRGRAPLPRPAVAARRRGRRAAGAQPPLGPLDEPAGDDLELLRKAHWAIDKVTERPGRPLRVQHRDRRRDGAGQRVLRGAARPALVDAALRDRDRRVADLPVRAALRVRRYELLTGDRVWEQPWPAADLALLERDTVEIVVQVNGKLRDRVQAPSERRPRAARGAGAGRGRTSQAHIDGHEVTKVIVVPAKLVNFVVR